MIRALLLRLLGFGFGVLYEVRSINQSTKKDLPGTRLFSSGSYRKALAAYKKEITKLKDDHKLKLQAVIIFRIYWRFSRDTVQQKANQMANERLENIKTVISGQGTKDSPFEPCEERLGPPPIVETSEPTIEADVQGVGGELPPGLSDGNAKGLFPIEDDPGDHECNYAGPMVMIEGKYTPTCSICDAVR